MPNLYSIQFEVAPADGQKASDLPAELLDRVAKWVGEKYGRSWNTAFVFPAHDNTTEPLPNHSVHHSCQTIGDATLIRVRWIHPDDRDTSMQWATEITIGRLDDRVQFALRLGATSLAFVLRPAWMPVGRPRIVTEILSDFSCRCGTFPILPQKEVVDAAEVPAFVGDVLLNAKRTLPVVVVSHDQFTNKTTVDPDKLHQSLLGLARVVVLDKWAAFRLTDSLGKRLSCFNGCVRIYWPGMTQASDPMQHELYFPISIEKFEIYGKPLDRRLFSFLSKVSTFRFAEGEVISEIHARLNAERLADSERIRRQIQQGANDAKTVEDLQPLYDLAIDENAALIERVKQLQQENADLTRDLNITKSNWDLFQQHQALSEEDEPVLPGAAEEVDLESPKAALDQAEHEFCDDLLFLDTAADSAGLSEFARPEEVYQALMAIRDVGQLYFDSVSNGTSMGGWGEQLSKRGFTQYSQTESDTVKNDYRKFGRYREFPMNGSKKRIYQHLDLGGGDRKNCLQIYFEADRELGKIIIAYCGDHLPYPGQRT
jgi:hypothetical protein